MSSDDVLTQAAQRLRELATQIDRQAALSARPGQLEVLERIAAKVRDCADVVHGAAVPVSAPTREALTDALREAFNTAYERSDNPRVDRMHRHDQHQYAGACHVCRGDIDVLVPHIADRLISAGLVRTPAPALDRETLGQKVRQVWIDWASEQPYPKASWLVPWEGLSEPDREVDRRIGETLARIGISACLTRSAAHPDYRDAT